MQAPKSIFLNPANYNLNQHKQSLVIPNYIKLKPNSQCMKSHRKNWSLLKILIEERDEIEAYLDGVSSPSPSIFSVVVDHFLSYPNILVLFV